MTHQLDIENRDMSEWTLAEVQARRKYHVENIEAVKRLMATHGDPQGLGSEQLAISQATIALCDAELERRGNA